MELIGLLAVLIVSTTFAGVVDMVFDVVGHMKVEGLVAAGVLPYPYVFFLKRNKLCGVVCDIHICGYPYN